MYNVTNVWETFREYIGSSFWFVLVIISAVYIFYCSRKETRRLIVVVLLVSAICLYNDLIRNLIGKVVEVATYYRFFWLMPVSLICAYAFILFWSRKSPKIFKVAVTMILAVVILLFEKNFLMSFPIPENKYQVPDDVFIIQDTIDYNKGNDERPVVCLPENLELCYRTVDPDVEYGLGRNSYLYYNSEEEHLTEIGDKYYLQQLVMYGNTCEPILLKEAIIAHQVDFIVTQTAFGLDEYMKSADCDLVGTGDVYSVYKVRYNDYDEVSSKIEAKTIMDKYEMTWDEETINIDGLSQAHQFLIVNDLHLVSQDNSVQEPYLETVNDRFINMSRTSTSAKISSQDLWTGLSSIIDAQQVDGVLFAGDIIDYSSATNAALAEQGMSQIDTPKMYCRADHDLGTWYSEGQITPEEAIDTSATICEYDDFYVMDYKEFYVVGWNNSTSQMSQEALNKAKEIFAKGKPIILVTHVPLNSQVDDGLYQASTSFDTKGRAKLWGENCLYQPNDVTGEFMNMVYDENTPVQAVICGHLHFKYTCKLTNQVTQYVFGPSFSGKIGLITVE